MKTFKAMLSRARDTSQTVEPLMTGSNQEFKTVKIKSAEFTFNSIGQFPDLESLFGKTVEIRIVD
jgi:hypothetical protein